MDACSISIVIVSYNTSSLLKQVLQNVRDSSKGLKIETIVVDNASKDNSVAMVQKEFPEVIMIASKENLGFAGGNNLGAKSAQGKYLVLLNSDAFFEGNALQIALEKMEKNPKAGLGGANLISIDRSSQASGRSFPSLWRHLKLLSGYDKSIMNTDQDRQVDWAPGAFSIIPRDLFRRLRGFDERFFLYYEEVDLCKRIKQADFQVWLLSGVNVLHLGGESAKTVTTVAFNSKGSQLLLWEMRSGFLYWYKHYGSLGAHAYYFLNRSWQGLRKIKHGTNPVFELLRQAWIDTQGGKISPQRPW